jgi:hypothetical protein
MSFNNVSSSNRRVVTQKVSAIGLAPRNNIPNGLIGPQKPGGLGEGSEFLNRQRSFTLTVGILQNSVSANWNILDPE